MEGPIPDAPDLALVRAIAGCGRPVIAEGRIRTPDQAKAAIEAGAFAVVVGSAITAPSTSRWSGRGGGRRRQARGMSGDSILAVDIGGTKMLAALVTGASRRRAGCRDPARQVGRGQGDGLAALVADWAGRYKAVAAAVTGQVKDGRWYTLNPAVLPIPSGFPLGAALADRLGKSVTLANDAQAAAWGEHRYGAGEGRTSSFFTISTGIGGGVVSGGRLLAAIMAGGERRPDAAACCDASRTSPAAAAWRRRRAPGATMSTPAASLPRAPAPPGPNRRAARRDHRPPDPRSPEAVRSAFVASAAASASRLDFPAARAALAEAPEPFHPTIRAAGLGKHAGVIGVADLARAVLHCKGD